MRFKNLVQGLILAIFFLLMTIVAVVAGFRKSGRVTGGVIGLLMGFMTPFISVYLLVSVLSPEADCSKLIICVQRPESAFMLFATYLVLVAFGSYVGGLLSANTALGLLTGLMAGTLSIPLAVAASLGRANILSFLYQTDIAIYLLLGVLGAASGAATGREKARELTIIYTP